MLGLCLLFELYCIHTGQLHLITMTVSYNETNLSARGRELSVLNLNSQQAVSTGSFKAASRDHGRVKIIEANC